MNDSYLYKCVEVLNENLFYLSYVNNDSKTIISRVYNF